MRRRTRGRVTPKGSTGSGTGTGRYTPPIPKSTYVSPRWVPWVMFTLLATGMLLIVTNYLEVLPGGAKNSYLLIGLGCITAGFITATRYR